MKKTSEQFFSTRGKTCKKQLKNSKKRKNYIKEINTKTEKMSEETKKKKENVIRFFEMF